MELAGATFALLLCVVLSGLLSRATRVPVPLVQIALGAAVFYADLASVDLDPEVFFLVLLPPLLFLDGWRIPKDDLFDDAPTILTLALGLVVFTVLGVGSFIHWLIPALPLPVAFALAAVISPTDPIAVSEIASRTPMPTRMRRILEGESLFNDASGLVCMRFAVAAALTGVFSLSDALLSFIWVAIGGLAIGAGTTWLLSMARSWKSGADNEGGGAQILTTLLIPSAVYLLAEHLHCSGILAAVAAGITMGLTPHAHWRATTRIRRTAVWDTVQFAANGVVFVLLGEQIPAIVAAAPSTVLLTGHASPWWLLAHVVLIVLALATLRYAWVWASIRIAFLRPGVGEQPLPASYRRLVLAMSVAGVRGAITLAGVLTLPLTLANGARFPGRDLAIALAAGVIVLSLVLATVVLPHALRGLVLPADPSRHGSVNKARSAAAEAAVRAVMQAADTLPLDAEQKVLYAHAAVRIAARYRQRLDQYADDDAAYLAPGTMDAIERQLRLAGLQAERDELLASAGSHGVKDIVLRRLVREVDLQEARYGG
jgi:CPA1 family monovalent cation:H+ antiporter